jgi:hypothetical protein
MAELAVVEGAAGLASSIITFVDISVKFGKLVRHIIQAQGNIPRSWQNASYLST